MAIWYCASDKWTAVTAWAALTTYVVGDLRRQLAAPTVGNERVFRVSAITTGISGAAEPTWTITKGGSTSDAGVTWTEVTGNSTYNATNNFAAPHARLRNVPAWAAAGDTVYVGNHHAATEAAAVSYTWPGTMTSPNVVTCVDDTNATPTQTTGATDVTSGANSYSVSGTVFTQGVAFTAGNGSSAASLNINATGGNHQYYKNCQLILGTTSSAAFLVFSASSGASSTYLEDTDFQFGNANQQIDTFHKVRWNGGSLLANASAPTALFRMATSVSCDVEMIGLDLSGGPAGMHLVTGGSGPVNAGMITFGACKLPSSWSGDLVSAAVTRPGFRAEMSACDNGDSMFFERLTDAFGKSREETATYTRTGGRTVPNSKASGTNPQPLSLKLDGTGFKCSFPAAPFVVALEPVFNSTLGSSRTITVPILFDSAADWNDNDIAIRVRYPATSGQTKYTVADSGPATAITTATALNTKFGASSGWTTTALSNPKQRQLQVTFTPQETGFILVDVLLYKQSLVYVDCPTIA